MELFAIALICVLVVLFVLHRGKKAQRAPARHATYRELVRSHRWKLSIPGVRSELVTEINMPKLTAHTSRWANRSTTTGKAGDLTKLGDLKITMVDELEQKQIKSLIEWINSPLPRKAEIAFYGLDNTVGETWTLTVVPHSLDFDELDHGSSEPFTFILTLKVNSLKVGAHDEGSDR